MQSKLFFFLFLIIGGIYYLFITTESYYNQKTYKISIIYPKDEVSLVIYEGIFGTKNMIPPYNYSLPENYQPIIIVLDKTYNVSAIYRTIFLMDGLNIFVVKLDDPYNPKIIRHKVYNFTSYNVWRGAALDTFDYFKINNKYFFFYYLNTGESIYIPCDYYISPLVGIIFDINLSKMVLLYNSKFPTKCTTILSKKVVHNNKTYYIHSRDNNYLILDRESLYKFYNFCNKNICILDIANFTRILQEGILTYIIGNYIEIFRDYINTVYRYEIENYTIILKEDMSSNLQEIASKIPNICKPLPVYFKLEDPNIVVFPIYGDVYGSGECKANIETKNIILVYVREYDGKKVRIIYNDFIKNLHYNITHYPNYTYILSLNYMDKRYTIEDRVPEGFWGPYIYPSIRLIDNYTILEEIVGPSYTRCYKLFNINKITVLRDIEWYCITENPYMGRTTIIDPQTPYSYLLIMKGIIGPYIKKYPPYNIISFQKNLTKIAESVNDLFSSQFIILAPSSYRSAAPYRIAVYELDEVTIKDLVLFTDKQLWVVGYYFNESIYIKAKSNISLEIDRLVINVIDEKTNESLISYIFENITQPILYKISFPYNESNYIINITVYDEGKSNSFIFKLEWLREQILVPPPEEEPTPITTVVVEEKPTITIEYNITENVTEVEQIQPVPSPQTVIEIIQQRPWLILVILIIGIMIYLIYTRKE